MTIDAKKILQETLNNPYGAPVVGFTSALKIAISVMEKYELIEQIVGQTFNEETKYRLITEVLEDGKNT